MFWSRRESCQHRELLPIWKIELGICIFFSQHFASVWRRRWAIGFLLIKQHLTFWGRGLVIWHFAWEGGLWNRYWNSPCVFLGTELCLSDWKIKLTIQNFNSENSLCLKKRACCGVCLLLECSLWPRGGLPSYFFLRKLCFSGWARMLVAGHFSS